MNRQYEARYRTAFLATALLFLIFLLPPLAQAAVPNPPSNLAATALSSTQIKLTWTDNSTDETYFYIEYRKSTDVNFTTLTSVGANTVSYTHTNLLQNTGYVYRVRAYNSSGYSAYTNEATATTMILNAPTNLSLSGLTYTKVTLTWTDNSGDETYFYVERKTGAGGTYAVVATLGANTTTYTNTGLTQGTEYYFRVRASSGSNYSDYTNEASTVMPVLPAPSGLSAAALSSTQIKLTWTDNSSDETYFYIEYKKATDTNFASLTSVSANVTTYTHSSLLQNTTYVYRVRAYHSGSSAYSAYSNEASATTLNLNAPSGLTTTLVSYSKINLAWTDNSSDETYFYLERKTGSGGTYAVIATLGANVTTYSNTGLAQHTEYFYRVRAASGSNYSQYSNEVDVTTLMLNAPSNLSASPASSAQINLSWTDNSGDEGGFAIERKTTGSYSQIATVSPNVTTYSNTGLSQNTQYSYRVRAYNGSDYSVYSNETGTTTPAFNAPSNLTAAALSSTDIKLSWKDNSNDETSFSIEYKAGSGGTYTVVTTASPNTTTYTHTGLTSGATYYYRVRGYNGVTYSSYSNEANAITPDCNQQGTYQP